MLRKETGKATVGQLRELLQQRFPRWEPAVVAGLATGIPGIDGPLGGGLPRGAVSEVVEARAGAGGQLMLTALLGAVRKKHRFLALVDAMDGFDPQSTEPDLLRHLLWVRSGGVTPALRAADLLARDNNMAALVIDLRDAPDRELRRIQSTVWFRFQRVVETTEMALVVMTPHALVSSARIRLQLDHPLSLAALDHPRRDLLTILAPELNLRRQAAQPAEAAG
ncbi:MAG: hypothetical protein R3F07_13025 [Opitutaceae bacterium]